MTLPHPDTPQPSGTLDVDGFASVALDMAQLNQHNIIGFNSGDIKTRALNLLRSEIRKRAVANGWRLVGITSATPAAGKSFVSANLASSIASLGHETVYLVDLDLRRCSVAERFGFPSAAGVEAFLDGSVSDVSAIGYRIDSFPLVVVPCFPTERDSANLLAGKSFEALFETLRNRTGNGLILFDMPPAFANDDAAIIAQQLDCYILIVEQGVTTARQIEHASRLLAPTPCLGTILNRYTGGFGDPYGYGRADPYQKHYATAADVSDA